MLVHDIKNFLEQLVPALSGVNEKRTTFPMSHEAVMNLLAQVTWCCTRYSQVASVLEVPRHQLHTADAPQAAVHRLLPAACPAALLLAPRSLCAGGHNGASVRLSDHTASDIVSFGRDEFQLDLTAVINSRNEVSET